MVETVCISVVSPKGSRAMLSDSLPSSGNTPVRGEALVRKRVAITLSPRAISGHSLHGRPTAGPAGTWTLRLSLGHAGAGLCSQATAHVNDLVLRIRPVRRRIPRPGAHLDQGQRRQQGKHDRRQFHFGFYHLPHGLSLACQCWIQPRENRRVKPHSYL